GWMANERAGGISDAHCIGTGVSGGGSGEQQNAVGGIGNVHVVLAPLILQGGARRFHRERDIGSLEYVGTDGLFGDFRRQNRGRGRNAAGVNLLNLREGHNSSPHGSFTL